jgi:ribonuclease P protein component
VNEGCDKTNIPAEYPSSEAQARVSRPDEDEGRARHPESPPREGPRAAVGLNDPARDRVRTKRTISSSREFERVYARGRRSRRGPLTIFAAPGESPAAPSRLGLAVRISGAVPRNRARRRLREAFRQGSPTMGVDVVIRGGAGVVDVDFSELVKAVRAGCSGVGEGS